ncbi:membrane protein [Salmonella enterica subsp. enterica]|uniref:Membrane protein n=1 Tax=Salmonella enterica I TaxID=59201 RepID=A0A3S4J652_SALET|nr:membrane protein [Salmonella enterica subsp. enterica]
MCSAGLFAASGVLYVKSRAPEAPAQAATPAPEQTQAAVPAPVAKTTFTTAQIDQWVAPVALYPDALLSQVLMASTYPANVVQAVQWSRDNPTLQGDAAIQAVASQPWDPSVKSLVAFPQLMALMGENPQWVQNLGDAFLSPATGCDGCGAKAASARSTNRFAKIHATANRHQRAEVQRFYRRHDDNHHIRQYASDTVDRYKN